MRILKPVASLVAVLALSACGAPDTQEEPLATSSAALTSGVSRGCTFYVSSQQKPGTFPPQYEVRVNRVASSTCAWGGGSVVIGTTYNSPSLSLAANDLGVAASFTYKGTPSGSAAVVVYVDHVAPDTLSIVRTTGLGAMNPGYAGYVYGGELSILSDGTTLEVRGTKSGTIPGETGGGSNYTATYPDFFTSTTPPTVVAS
ncbi:hypothetical protein JRI60_16590 [Archangium violaceum]|uniref:hypothetical protein n=1 Tax=Archangium violaceum TaxID=83451 RepID=UPI00194F81DE|nr:hypothetical protein [Archangium violaceum]QRO00532.1 hypothetical protein JRI60_16590 [Archangium violaceum]